MTNPYSNNERSKRSSNNAAPFSQSEPNQYGGSAAPSKLHRSRTDKYVAGVLGGIGETYNIDSNLLRILFLASILLPGPQVLLYLAMWFFIPDDPR